MINMKKLLNLVRGERLDRKEKYKCCLIWFVYTIFLIWDRLKNIEVNTIKMTDSIKFFEEYPWGNESFDLTMDYLKRR